MPKATYEEIAGKPGHYQAKFGRTLVTLSPRTGVREIYRGKDGQGYPLKVGEWPERGYFIVVHGSCSASAGELDAAMAHGEYLARTSDSNDPRGYIETPALKYALTPERARQVVEAEQADSDALMARFPYLPEEAEALAAINERHKVASPAEQSARRIAELSSTVQTHRRR